MAVGRSSRIHCPRPCGRCAVCRQTHQTQLVANSGDGPRPAKPKSFPVCQFNCCLCNKASHAKINFLRFSHSLSFFVCHSNCLEIVCDPKIGLISAHHTSLSSLAMNKSVTHAKRICTCFDEYSLRTLATMRQSGTFTDCTIILDDGSQFAVHKIVLCSSSKHFKCLLLDNGNNKKDGCTENIPIVVPNISPSIMHIIINYIYTHAADISAANVLELFAASNQLQIHSLVQLCGNYILTEMLSVNNCLQLLVHARQHAMAEWSAGHQRYDEHQRHQYWQQLHDCVRRYVAEHFSTVAQSNFLLDLSADVFADLIADDRLNVKDEQMVWTCCQRWLNHDAVRRMPWTSRLLKTIRLGLMDKAYFRTEVMRLPALRESKSAKLLIDRTIEFWARLNEWPDDLMTGTMLTTPDIAMPRIPTEVVIVIGGLILNVNSVLMESYDLRADKWIDLSFGSHRMMGGDDCQNGTPSSPVPQVGDTKTNDATASVITRCYHGTVTIGYNIYCIGGFDGHNYLSQCMVFDVRTKCWQEIAPMHEARCHVAVAVHDGRIYAIGGFDGAVRLRSMEVYDPGSNQWTMLPSMHHRRSDGAACTLHGRIYAIGGFNGTTSHHVAEYYDLTANRWHIVASMMTRRSGLACVAHRGCMYAVGGFDGFERLPTIEKYDPASDAWHTATEMINARSNFGLTIADGLMFAIGGFDGISILTQTECYSFDSNTWIEANNLNHPRLAATACTISSIPNVQDYTCTHREDLLMNRILS